MPPTVLHEIRIDLHVHTRRYSACAEGLNPDRLPERMAQAGIDGLVITEHDYLWSREDIARLNRGLNKGRIYRGVEVSSCNGHFVVIGLQTLSGIARGIDISSLVQLARVQEAAIIWAHPQQCYSNTAAPCTFMHLPDNIDAVEVASSITEGERSREAMAMAGRMGWAQVGGSDAHILKQVGCAVTRFESLPADESALAKAIRSGRCTAQRMTIPDEAKAAP